MLAKRLPTILPPLNLQEALETTKIHSVAGKLQPDAMLIATATIPVTTSYHFGYGPGWRWRPAATG